VPEPAVSLAVIMATLLTAYVLLGGADYGGGVWDLLAWGEGEDAQRATIARAIAPVWEANHVWLIVVITILFNAFPVAFARLSVQLHIPLALMLVGIVLRGSAFVFRAYGPTGARWVRAWSVVFAGASTATPVFLGAVVGAITEGKMDPNAAGFSARYLTPWLTPFALSVGGFALVLFAYLAAVYLTLEADDAATAETFRLRAIGSAVATGLMALVVFVLADQAPHIRAALARSPWALPLHAVTGASASAALFCLWTRRFWFARLAAAAQVTFIVWGWALAQYPYLIRPDLLVEASAAPRPVLVILLKVLALGAVLLLPALFYLFRIFGPTGRHILPRSTHN
jgi:cytochrome d ubiquinol oxidase subunit II